MSLKQSRASYLRAKRKAKKITKKRKKEKLFCRFGKVVRKTVKNDGRLSKKKDIIASNK